MRRFDLLRRITLVIVAAVAALVASTVPASASGSAGVKGPNVGTVDFHSHGEHFYVNDWKADGHGVKGVLDVKECTPEGRCWWSTEAIVYNNKGFHAPAKHANLKIKDGRKVRYRACLNDGGPTGTSSRCGKPEYDYA